jgi:putative FmdB family regulatory protein
MPLYEFRCLDCERESEVLVRSNNWQGTRCPHCGSEHLEKLLSSFASTTSESRGEPVAACTGNPGSCGRCGGGGMLSH